MLRVFGKEVNMKRSISLILIGAILFGALNGCSEQKPAQEQEEAQMTAPVPAEVPDTEPEETDILDTLPEGSFGGRDYTILLRTGMEYEFFSEEQTGEIINDTIFERNNFLNERYDIAVRYVDRAAAWGGGDSFNTELNSMILSGDSNFDIVAGYAAMILGAVKQGLFLNWYDIPHVDVEKPWWSPQIADSLTINGKLYAMTGDIALSIWEDMVCIYYNQKLAVDYNTGDFYELVKNGEWTFEKLLSAASRVTADLNGDGSYSNDDLFGYVSNASTAVDTYLPAFDIQIVKRGEDGWLNYTMNTERMIGALERMRSLFFSGDNFAMLGDNLAAMFRENHALFFADDLRTSAKLRDMENNYGMISQDKDTGHQSHAYDASKIFHYYWRAYETPDFL